MKMTRAERRLLKIVVRIARINMCNVKGFAPDDQAVKDALKAADYLLAKTEIEE